MMKIDLVCKIRSEEERKLDREPAAVYDPITKILVVYIPEDPRKPVLDIEYKN